MAYKYRNIAGVSAAAMSGGSCRRNQQWRRRQHGENLVSSNNGVASRWQKRQAMGALLSKSLKSQRRRNNGSGKRSENGKLWHGGSGWRHKLAAKYASWRMAVAIIGGVSGNEISAG